MSTTHAAGPEDAVLSREQSELLVELSVGLHKYAMYPDGHPLLESAVVGITRRLAPLLAEQTVLAVGVERNRLTIDGARTDANNSVMRDLALKLYRREVGAVRLEAGVDDAELTDVLKAIARDAKTQGGKSAEAVARREWPHVRLLPLTYDQLALQHEEDAEAPAANWASQLWSKLAQSTIVADGAPGLTLPELPRDALELARAIEAHGHDPALDRGLLAALGQLLDEVKVRGSAAAVALKQRVSQLVRSLTPAAVQRLLKVNDPAQRRQFLINASNALAADTVLDLAKAAAAATQHSMSEAMLLLLSKMARHAQEGSAARRDRADAALRANVRQLIDDWDGAAALPEDEYWKTLERLIDGTGKAQGAPSTLHEVAPETVVQMSLELEVFSATTKHAVAEMIKHGQVGRLLALADGTPDANKVVFTLRRHLDNTGTIKRLLRDRPIDFEVLYRLVARVGAPAAGALLDALEQEDDRTARWKLFEMLAELGPDVGKAVVARLAGAPWYVQRNLLLLLARLPEWPAGFTPLPYAKHADARVRREAYALLLRDAKSRDQAVVQALSDDDERIVRAALTAALESGCPRDAMPVITRRLTARALDGMLGVLAIRVIASLRFTPVLEALVAVTLSPKRRWFRRRLAEKSPVMLAALAVLAGHWTSEPAAQKVLAVAAGSHDPEVQEALRAGAKKP